ncbi:zinc-dependent metalloprotease [Haloechinothrix halophila]|uniref:zinc-dependent metalloprotease n=1 Tax=Haloechinothrix halophila TaxID=1069073 RepID=UPI0003FED14D|nr:zinc-dependent metalloprotease [Haloechinothrix halophila]
MDTLTGRDAARGDPDSPVHPLVDWSVAATTGALLVGGGPDVPREVADKAVAQLGEFSTVAEQHVRDVTGLGEGLPIPEAAVVDRRAWVRSAAAGLDALTSSALASSSHTRGGPVGRLMAGGAGVQTGLALAFLGSKVLGQYDPFARDREGVLLLVAPNIVQAEHAMDVDSDDFRLWVCLHECTHRLQFNAVDWLADYFADEVGRFISGIDDTAARSLNRLPDVIRNAKHPDGTLGVFEALQSPRQRESFNRLIAVSTLLEGHADFVMDEVGPEIVPSVASIRRKFTERRKGGGLFDRILRALLGIDAKIKQYERGSKFTKHVVGAVGMAGFNEVWRSPDTLPTRDEISEPDTWLRRVHG